MKKLFTVVLCQLLLAGIGFAQENILLSGQSIGLSSPENPREFGLAIENPGTDQLSFSIKKPIIGFIYDEEGIPLPGASVILRNGSQFQMGVTSDESGYFELTGPGDTVEISFMGCETFTLDLPSLREDEMVYLKEKVFELGAVIVKGDMPIFKSTGGCILSGYIYGPDLKEEKKKEVKEVKEIFDLTIFPNPTTDFVFLSSGIGGGNYYLISSEGKILQQKINTPGTNHFDLRAVAAGSYFLRFEKTGMAPVSRMVVKVKN